MAAEVENQELHKDSKFSEADSCQLSSCLGDTVGDRLWLQPSSTEGKLENCERPATKANSGVPSNDGLTFNKDETKSSADSLAPGGIWSQKPSVQMEGVWPSGTGGLDWRSSRDGIANLNVNKDANKNYPWGANAMQDNHGTTNALNLSLDFWKPGALGVSSAWEDSNRNNWGLTDMKAEFSKEGLPDKKIGGEQDRSKGLWNAVEERKVDPIGPVQRRSASLTELNVTFDSSSLGGESVKFSSTGKVGVNDERSQPDGAEVSQQNREELIAKMINSNEGWGKKPVIQETPWQMETVAAPPVADPAPSTAEESNSANKDVFWNVSKENTTPSWNSNPPAPTNSYEWAPDSDIGMWNGPPPPESINPNVWTGPPKETSPVWLGGQSGMGQGGHDKNPMQGGGMTWGDRGLPASGGGDKFSGRDGGGLDHRLRGTEAWGQQGSRGAFDNNWTSNESNTWGMPHPADQQDSWGAKPMGNFSSSSGFNAGSKAEPIQKIGTWGEGMTTETGLWNQSQPLSNMQNPLQQLMDLGLKREEALALQNSIGQNPMGMEKLLEMIKIQKENEHPRGRIIRGKSMVEMPNNHFGQFQGGRNNFQTGGQSSAFQSSIPGGLPSQMHFKGSGNQQSVGAWPNVYGRTTSMQSAMQQPMPQMNPQMLQSLLHLQSLLQPLLHQRSQVQHNRNLTQMQKTMQIEQLNVYIADLKHRIDQVQLSFGPPPPVAGGLPVSMMPSDAQIGVDDAKMIQLLNQLKLERDFGSMPHPPLGPGELDGKALGGISNVSANQMAALIGSSPWINSDSSAAKDKLPMSDIMPDTWTGLGQTGGSMSKMGWPMSGDFGASKGARPPPPPGLGNCDKTEPLWNQQLVNRSTSWAPGVQLGLSSNWLMIKNISSSLDPALLQKICFSYGPLQNFYYNKMLGQVLVCYINRDDVIAALSGIAQNLPGSGGSRLITEPVAVEDIGRLIDGSWTPIPPSSSLFGAIPSNAKSNPLRGGGAMLWGMDGM